MNKTEVTKVFEEYVVDETAEAADGYAGIITGVKVEKSLASNGVISYNDYTIAVNVLVDENGELKQYKKYYRNILTRGRNHFQNLISDFELIKEENGNHELRLDLLLGRICEVVFGMTNCIKNITIPDFEDEETKDEITAILKKEADIADGVDVPDKIKNYTIIPVVDQADGFSINTKYTAVIKKIDCFKDKAHPDDVTIRVSAYLYNGGTTEKYCKYFNCVHSKGKEEFDEFCKVFDSTIVGGPQAVDLKEQFLHDTNCDFVIEGEGEEPIYQLLSSLIDELCSLKDVQSLRYIDQNGIYCENTLAKPFCNLDEIPFPSKKRCIDGRFRNDNSFGIITGRGCPFNCAFCYEGANTKQVRLRTIDNVMSEIDFALSENKNLKYLNIYDDTFTLDFKRVSEFCDKIKSRNLLWYCEGHTSNIVNNPEIIEKMVESGMIGLQIGIESGSEKVLKAYNKQTNPDMLIKVVEICKNAGLTRLVGNFIVGGAFETERTIYKSMELAKQMLTTGKGMFECKTVFLAPYPHTSITLNPQNYDLEYHKENELTCAYSMHMPLMTPKTMKYDKLIELKLKFDNMIETTIKELSLFPDKLDIERNFFKSGKRLTANSKWRNNYLEQEHIVNYLEACFSINGQVEKRYTDNEILEMYPLRTFNLLQYENEKLIYGEYRFEYESAYLLKYSAGKLKFKEIILNSPYRSEDMLKAYHALNNKCLIYISEF